MWYYDWEGQWKLVTAAGKTALCGPDVSFMSFSAWFNDNYGRPAITAVVAVPEEFYEAYKERFENAGLLCSRVDNEGGGL